MVLEASPVTAQKSPEVALFTASKLAITGTEEKAAGSGATLLSVEEFKTTASSARSAVGLSGRCATEPPLLAPHTDEIRLHRKTVTDMHGKDQLRGTSDNW
jgi:hypothetical protein